MSIHILRSKVHLFHSIAGWPQSWKDYDNPNMGMVHPTQPPHDPADMRYYYDWIGREAAELDVDGVIITTPHVRGSKLDDEARMLFEARLYGLRQDSSVCDAQAIDEGLRSGFQHFRGEWTLYTGMPDEMDSAIWKDNSYCDGIVKASVGPWLGAQRPIGAGIHPGRIIRRAIVDSAGLQGTNPGCQAVIKSIRRNYPGVAVGAEGHCGRQQYFACGGFLNSLTTDESWKHIVWGPKDSRGRPSVFTDWRTMTGPIFCAYTTPKMFDFEAGLELLRQGFSVAVQPWQISISQGKETQPGALDRWRIFMRQARKISENFRHVPDKTLPASPATS
jgi:hypothetical protein